MIVRRGHSAVLLVLFLSTCPAMLGCGDSGPSNTTVKGRVEVTGGIPLGEGKLVLVPENPLPGQQPAGATIAADGTFSCYSASGGSGIPPGSYKVMVSFPSGMSGAHPLRATFKKYTSLETTPLRLDVPEQGLTDVVFTLEDEAS